jgi:hypothetical protein
MAMKSMKMTPAERKAEVAEYEYKPPEYPYGLQLSLDEDQIKALGLADMTVGATVMISAKAKVTSVSASSSENHDHRCCSLQITDMEVDPEGESQAGKSASKLYPSS